MGQNEFYLGSTWVKDPSNPGHYYRLEDGLKRVVPPPKTEPKKQEVDGVAIGITTILLVLLTIAVKFELPALPASPALPAPQPPITSWSRGN
jgi:hypothetical protein